MQCTVRSVFLSAIVVMIGATLAEAQDRDLIVRMTTPIEVHFKRSVPNFGSAFYFQKLGPIPDPTKNEPQWRAILGLYLVTAKHVIEPPRIKDLTSVKFFLRKPGSSGVEWLPITLSAQDVRERLHVNPNPAVDIAVLDVMDLINAEINKLTPQTGGANQPTADQPSFRIEKNGEIQTVPLSPYYAVTEDNFPTKSKIKVSAGDDIVVIGYPERFFDRYNKLPILKSGLLITPNGVRYDNLDAFLIDFKEYEGLSGSVVITKPTDFVVEDGRIFVKQGGKDFVFLGVYAGQRYKRTQTNEQTGADLGVGWYYYNLDDSIKAPPLFATK